MVIVKYKANKSASSQNEAVCRGERASAVFAQRVRMTSYHLAWERRMLAFIGAPPRWEQTTSHQLRTSRVRSAAIENMSCTGGQLQFSGHSFIICKNIRRHSLIPRRLANNRKTNRTHCLPLLVVPCSWPDERNASLLRAAFLREFLRLAWGW